jgi:hypothetical protein
MLADCLSMARSTSDQWEQVSFKSLITLSAASQKMQFVIDKDVLLNAENLKMASLCPGHVIEVLASDQKFYPATITSKTKTFFTVTNERTKGLEHEVVWRAQYTTHWPGASLPSAASRGGSPRPPACTALHRPPLFKS